MAYNMPRRPRRNNIQVSALGRALIEYMKKYNSKSTKKNFTKLSFGTLPEAIGESYSRLNRIKRGNANSNAKLRTSRVIVLLKTCVVLNLRSSQFWELLYLDDPQIPIVLNALDSGLCTPEFVDMCLIENGLPQLFDSVHIPPDEERKSSDEECATSDEERKSSDEE